MNKSDKKGDQIRAKILNFIIVHKMTNGGQSPTIREIISGCGMSSTSVAFFHLRKMENLGMIWLANSHIQVPGGNWLPPKWWHTGADADYCLENVEKTSVSNNTNGSKGEKVV